MKTILEVQRHCKRNGYDAYNMGKICGWLVAKGIKGENESILFKNGTGKFDDFIKWFNGCEKQEGIKPGDVICIDGNKKVFVMRIVKEDEAVFGIDENRVLGTYNIDENTSICGADERKDFIGELNNAGIEVCDIYTEEEDEEDFLDYISEKIDDLSELPGSEDHAEIADKITELIDAIYNSEMTDEAVNAVVSILEDVAMFMSDENDEDE